VIVALPLQLPLPFWLSSRRDLLLLLLLPLPLRLPFWLSFRSEGICFTNHDHHPAAKSSHVGFTFSINTTFSARFQSLSSFSRAIALRTY
jgi:hypothetical protein